MDNAVPPRHFKTQSKSENWVIIKYLDARGNGIKGAHYEVKTSDGKLHAKGTLQNKEGSSKIVLPAHLVGTVQVHFFDDPSAHFLPGRESIPSALPTTPNWQIALQTQCKAAWAPINSSTEWTWGLLQSELGESTTVGQLISNTIITAIPLVDHEIDARELINYLHELIWEQQHTEDECWQSLFTTCLGLVPHVGAMLKSLLKLLSSGTHIEQVIALFNYYQQGNGIKWLKELHNSTFISHIDYAAHLLHEIFEKLINTLKQTKVLIPVKLASPHQQIDDLLNLVQSIKKQINSNFSDLAQIFSQKLGNILNNRIRNTQSGVVRSLITLRQTSRNPPLHSPPASNFLDCTPPNQSSRSQINQDGTCALSATTERLEADAMQVLCNGAVSMVTGEVILSLEDFTLPGPIPFIWHRTYRSGNYHNHGLGKGWHHLLAEKAYIQLKQQDTFSRYYLFATLYDGKTIPIPCPQEVGVTCYNTAEQVSIKKINFRQFSVKKFGENFLRIFEVFNPDISRKDKKRSRSEKTPYPKHPLRLVRLQNTEGYGWQLEYNTTNPDISSSRPLLIEKVTRLLSDWGTTLQIHYTQHYINGITYEASDGKTVLPPLIRYKYSNDGYLINAKDRSGYSEKYQYKNSLLISRELKSGFKFYFEWDGESSSARCSSMRGDNHVYYCQFFWMQAQQRSVKKDISGATCYYHFNQRGQLLEEVDPEHQVYRYEYNDEGQVVARQDPLERSNYYTYDSCGRLSAMTNAADQTTYFSYDDHDNLCRLTKPGAEPNEHLSWHYEYNQHGKLIHVQTPTGDNAHYEYDHRGLLTKALQPPYGEMCYIYNDAGQLIKEINENKLETRYKYNKEGYLSTTITPDQQTTSYKYDAIGRLYLISSTLGTIEVKYSPCGEITRYKDASGFVTSFEYAHGLPHMTQRNNADGSTIKYEYDQECTLVAITNENGERYQFQYDKNKRLVAEVGFDGKEQRYAYNAAGDLIYHEDSGLYETHFSRDILGRLTQKSSNIIKDINPAIITDYRYDGIGRLFAAKNSHSFVRFDYDKSDNITHELLQRLDPSAPTIDIKNVKSQSIYHHYNKKQQRIETTLPDGKKIKLNYNSRGLESLSFNNKMIARFKRDALGLEYRRQQGVINTYWSFDSQNRLTSQHSTNISDNSTIIKRRYHYDARNLLIKLEDLNTGIRSYSYDPREKLRQITSETTNEHFRFDPSGNLVKHEYSRNDESTYIKHLVNEENRLFLHGDRQFNYDSAGNLIEQLRGKNKKTLTQYIYNANQELTEVRHSSKYSTLYTYDPLGRRLSKQDSYGKTLFLWQGDHLLQEFKQLSNHSPQASEKNSVKTYIFEPDSFRPLACIHNHEDVHHYHLDHLGSPQEITNQSGDTIWQAKYYAYGSIESQSTTLTTNHLRFPGHYFDEETGFHYSRYRYYDPQSGRFIQQDPAGLAGSINLYQYCPNPIVWIDPLGLKGLSLLSNSYYDTNWQVNTQSNNHQKIQFKQRIHTQYKDHDFLSIGIQPLKSLNITYKQTAFYHFQDFRCDHIIATLNQAITPKS